MLNVTIHLFVQWGVSGLAIKTPAYSDCLAPTLEVDLLHELNICIAPRLKASGKYRFHALELILSESAVFLGINFVRDLTF
jgi:hypothetical protein